MGKKSGRRSARDVVEAVVDSGTATLEPDPDRARAWTLLLDGTPQSHVDLDDPAWLQFEYVRRLGHVVDLIAPERAPLRTLHLGGGGWTLPRYVAETRPRSRQQVAEIDAGLVEFVRRELPLDAAAQVKLRTGDARAVLEKAPDDVFDLVVADVFSGARTPAHLTTTEYVAQVARALRPGGVYAANLADGNKLEFVRTQLATVRSVFSEVLFIADPAVLRGRRFGNVLIVASDRELPVADLGRRTASDPFPGRVEHGTAVSDFTGGAVPVTDATAVASPEPPAGSFSFK